MPRETMTPRERCQAVLDGKKPDRVPMDLWATRETFALLCRHLGCEGDEALRRLHGDGLIALEPEYIGPPIEKHMDMWGVCFERRSSNVEAKVAQGVSHGVRAGPPPCIVFHALDSCGGAGHNTDGRNDTQ